MTSNGSSFNDGSTRLRDAPTTTLLDGRKTSSTFASSNNRSSYASNETGESSTAASKRNSLTANGVTNGSPKLDRDESLDIEQLNKDGRGSFRSHRNRASGGFLLSTPASISSTQAGIAVQAGPKHRSVGQESKGRTALRSSEKRHAKKRSIVGSGLGASPLATYSLSEASGNGKEIDSKTVTREALNARSGLADSHVVPKGTAGSLDVDSAQIVNLALNLSESRRNASRRFVSTPLPQASGGLGESTGGGSLRQHLQQQRRSSRNISPKPDRGDRTMGPMTRAASAAVSSPLQSVFDTQENGQYEYHFSASTLARAEKARNTIELMAQYRRLLHYVPPLKPQPVEKPGPQSDGGGSLESPSSSVLQHSRSPSLNATALRQLGRPYNPLQYIRNRKVRSRTSKTIDGEAQGFGDLEKVSCWIDTVAQESTTEEYQRADCEMIPKFSKSTDDSVSPFGSPQSSSSRNHAAQIKAKRPRIDWITNPADMLADIFWAEQEDNKKLLESRSGHPIFPRHLELKRPLSRKPEDEPEPKKPPTPAKKMQQLGVEMKLDTQLPEFKSVKSDGEKLSDWAANKAKQKLKHVANIHHGHSGSSHSRHRFRSKSRSESDSSDSDVARPPRRRRSGTADSHDRGTDILEKQMMQMLAREAREAEERGKEQHIPKIFDLIEPHHSEPHKAVERAKEPADSHSRSGSLVARIKKGSENNGSSGRASLEVPGASRGSIDGFDGHRRSSSLSRTNRIAGVFMGRDRSRSRSRPSSPTRRPLSRMGSKIRPLYHRTGRHPEPDPENAFVFPASKDQTAEAAENVKRDRSSSPTKKTPSKLMDSNQKPVSRAGSIRKVKGEDSGIRGLFKGPRNTVSKVSEYLWKKDTSPGAGVVSGFSTDDSDIEDVKKIVQESKGSRDSSISRVQDQMDNEVDVSGIPSRLADMPIFTSPFERRGRPSQSRKEDLLSRSLMTRREQADQDRRASSRGKLQEAPRIDVHNASPNTSPDTGPVDRFHRDSSVSEIGSYHQGVKYADARLNSILGIPGRRRNALPITGLARLEATNRRPSLAEDHMRWSISDISVNDRRAPMSKREIARVRALLLSSGIKAKEISRRAAELHNMKTDEDSAYRDIAALADQDLKPVPKHQEHRLAARILSEDIQNSARVCQSSAETFSHTTVTALLTRIGGMQSRLVNNLTPMTRSAADEADEVSKDLVTSQTLQVKIISDKMDKMMRRRRRRFRWVRRGGWVMVEWVLVGVMWGVWFLVMLVRVILGIGNGVVGGLRWLFWL